jgi:senataxin
LTDTPPENGTQPGRLSNPTGLNLPRPSRKKLLVCAPSNAAVDELVLRFKQGVTNLEGQVRKLSVVRLGKSDVINVAVRDVTLEELVKVRAGAMSKTPNHADEIHQLVEEHKGLTEAINATRTALEEARAKGSPTVDLSRMFELQKRKKSEIGRRLDNLRDAGNTAARDAEIHRRKLQQEILDGASIICSTLSGSGHEMMRNINIEFETVVIDEAAQSIELSALIPLKYGCSKCILVGDPKQLPPTVLSREAARFQYEQSLFVRMQTNHPSYVHLLDTQYRMHPEISRYPSRAFYDEKLMDGENMAKIREKPWHASKLLGPYRFFDVQGQQTNASRGHSLINKAEVNVALQLFERLTTDYKGYDFRGKIGIITPYKSQLSELKARFLQSYGDSIFTHVEFNTTDAFQGRESEVIIFSCVRASSSRGIGFLADIRRMNVGLTRAKSSLWVLGNSQSLIHGEFWENLIKDAKSRECYTDGDLTALLQRPMAKLNPNEYPWEDTMSDTQAGQLCHSPLGDVEMEDAPPLDSPNHSDIRSSFQPNPTNEDGRLQSYRPPLQDRPPIGISCNICGSDTHYTSNCTNSIAKAAALGTCSRCGDPHFGSCSAVRCSRCGKFGHATDTCSSSSPLPKAQQEVIQRQETAHETRNKKYLEKMRKKQLGDHDPQVPAIVTASSQPHRNRSISSSDPRPDGKRKRGTEPHEPLDALIVPKSNKVRRRCHEYSKYQTNPPSRIDYLPKWASRT